MYMITLQSFRQLNHYKKRLHNCNDEGTEQQILNTFSIAHSGIPKKVMLLTPSTSKILYYSDMRNVQVFTLFQGFFENPPNFFVHKPKTNFKLIWGEIVFSVCLNSWD